MINLPLMKCTLHILDYLWFGFFDVKRIQNVTSFLRTFYVPYPFKVLGFCTLLCFRLLLEYSHVSRKSKDCCLINT